MSVFDYKAGTTAYFKDINLGLDVGVLGLMSSTLAEMQAIALALECIPLSSSVYLYLDSQSVLDACRLKLGLVCPDFCNQCWIEYWYVINIICNKNLKVSWHKVKGYSGQFFSPCLSKCFLMTDGNIVSGNSRHFLGSGSKFLTSSLLSEHSDLHMATGFISRSSVNICTYFIKALYHHLWFCEAVSIFYDLKIASLEVVKFVHFLSLAFKENICSAPISVFGLALGLSAGVVKLLGINEAFDICFGFCQSDFFFSGIDNPVSVHIAV
ncbi:hypothetical protein G9A89_015731 [Geosiphon pyriformis]|nr:hypothetical protein G9A89_015731 [Geosiphon pyriformis]